MVNVKNITNKIERKTTNWEGMGGNACINKGVIYKFLPLVENGHK